MKVQMMNQGKYRTGTLREAIDLIQLETPRTQLVRELIKVLLREPNQPRLEVLFDALSPNEPDHNMECKRGA